MMYSVNGTNHHNERTDMATFTVHGKITAHVHAEIEADNYADAVAKARRSKQLQWWFDDQQPNANRVAIHSATDS